MNQFFLLNFKKMTYCSTYNNNYHYYHINGCEIRQSKTVNHFEVVSLPFCPETIKINHLSNG